MSHCDFLKEKYKKYKDIFKQQNVDDKEIKGIESKLNFLGVFSFRTKIGKKFRR